MYGSRILESIVSSHRTYVSDVMIESALQIFIKGRSFSEISRIQAYRIGMWGALEASHSIYQENSRGEHPETQGTHEILHIADRRNNGFGIFHDRSCEGFGIRFRSACEEVPCRIRGIYRLRFEYSEFKIWNTIWDNMRYGIMSASEKIFPGIPKRVCLIYFLRDPGKDLMKDIHTDFGIVINKIGIKSTLKKMLREMLDYDQGTLDDLDYGFCSNREKMEIMTIRRVLENTLVVRSSGYGFPFSLRHLNFFMSCEDGMKRLTELSGKFENDESRNLAESIIENISDITDYFDI